MSAMSYAIEAEATSPCGGPPRGAHLHVLLIGVDAYPPESRFDALDGCVNDIDAVQRLLIDGLGVTPEQITRLASPKVNSVHADGVPLAPATRANIVSALKKLGRESVGPDDEVFIY